MKDEHDQSNYLWHTRINNVVKGPFTVGMVRRFVLIGRMSMDDEVSQDKLTWRRVKDTEEVIPYEMRNITTDEDRQRLLQAQLREDERSAKDAARIWMNSRNCAAVPRTGVIPKI